MKVAARPVVALVIMSLMWGYGWVSMKIGLLDAEPFTFTALRMSLSALVLLLALPLSGRRFLPTRIPELLKLGLVQTTLLFTLSTLAVHEGSAGRVAFLVYTMPFFTLAMAWPILGERISGLQWPAVALALIGIAAIIQPWQLDGDIYGNALAIGAGATWALGAIMIKQLQQRAPMDFISMTAWQMGFGCLPLIAIAAVIPEAPIVWSGRFIGNLILLTVFISGMGWALWVYALNNLSAGTASLATLAAPVVAIFASSYHFGEQPTTAELVGMLIITVALLVLSLNGMRALKRTPVTAGEY